MKKLGWTMLALMALGLPANAADMPARMPVKAPALVPVWSWTGLYVGANIGYSWGESDTTANTYLNGAPGTLLFSQNSKFDMNGVIGGLQLGYNWQNGKWVYGIETDIQLSGQDGGTNFSCPAAAGCNNLTFGAGLGQPITTNFNQKLDWFGTLRGRLGWTVTPTVLLYATGGLAYGHIKTDGAINGFDGAGDPVSAPFSYSDTKLGWTVGAGLEAQLTGRWTGKIEYLYMDLGSVSGTALHLTNQPPLRVDFHSDITDHILRVGANYRF